MVVVDSEAEAERRRLQKYYVPATRRLVIKRFKTSKLYPPYDFTLNAPVAKLLDASLRRDPRPYLLHKTGESARVSALFQEAGLGKLGVREIRRSHITARMRRNPGAKGLEAVAAEFKHSPEMTTRYYRGGDVRGD